MAEQAQHLQVCCGLQRYWTLMLTSYQHGCTQKVADNGVQWGSWCQLSRLFYLPKLYCRKLIFNIDALFTFTDSYS
jgi:hypothetical protein